MLAKNIFEKIGFTEEMVEAYNKYRNIMGDSCDDLAEHEG